MSTLDSAIDKATGLFSSWMQYDLQKKEVNATRADKQAQITFVNQQREKEVAAKPANQLQHIPVWAWVLGGGLFVFAILKK